VEDYPDLHHRALMLDVVRNYYPVDSIYKIIDVMAEYKLNVLHLHLSDDEAWRLEIPGLSQLTEIGSKRGYTTVQGAILHPKTVVERGVLGADCEQLMKDFFAQLRQ
jgi:hexosaminidase